MAVVGVRSTLFRVRLPAKYGLSSTEGDTSAATHLTTAVCVLARVVEVSGPTLLLTPVAQAQGVLANAAGYRTQVTCDTECTDIVAGRLMRGPDEKLAPFVPPAEAPGSRRSAL